MTGSGRPDLGVVAASGLRLGIVASRWNTEVVDTLLERALEAARACDVAKPTVVRVAGALELAVIAQQLAVENDAVVCLGAVLRLCLRCRDRRPHPYCAGRRDPDRQRCVDL
jgi:6,7-dimethyl-8-ribityllumazine synthase